MHPIGYNDYCNLVPRVFQCLTIVLAGQTDSYCLTVAKTVATVIAIIAKQARMLSIRMGLVFQHNKGTGYHQPQWQAGPTCRNTYLM